MTSYKIHTRSTSSFIFFYLGHLLLEHVYKSLTHSFINLLMCDRLEDMSNIAVFQHWEDRKVKANFEENCRIGKVTHLLPARCECFLLLRIPKNGVEVL